MGKKSSKFISAIILMLVMSLSFVLVSCKSEAPTLVITSDRVAYIGIGESYTLEYTSNTDVKVVVSGGTYTADTKTFTADTAGDYNLDVTAGKGKSALTERVVVNVRGAASLTELNALIAQAEALSPKANDYTNFAAVKTALTKAKAARDKENVTQGEVNEAKNALSIAINALTLKAIDRATTSDSKIVYEEITYSSTVYDNFAEIKVEIDELNADTTIKFNSDYKAKIDPILAKFTKFFSVDFSKLPGNGNLIWENQESYNLTVDSSKSETTYSWKIDDKEVSTTKDYTFTPVVGQSYNLKVAVTYKQTTETAERNFNVNKAKYVVSEKRNDIIAVDGLGNISVTGGMEWNDGDEGRKVELSEIKFVGNFSIEFDAKWTERINQNIFTMHLFKDNANWDLFGWGAILAGTNKLETAVDFNGIHKPQIELPENAIQMNKINRYRITREIINNKSYLKTAILDAEGNVIAENLCMDGKNRKSNDYIGAIKVGFNFENIMVDISGITCSVNNEVLRTELALSNALIASDYVQEVDFAAKKAAASIVLNNPYATKTEIDEAAAALTAVREALTVKEVTTETMAVVSADSIVFKGVTYSNIYTNFDKVKTAVIAINASEYTLQSEYDSAFALVIAALSDKTLKFTVNNLSTSKKYCTLVSDFAAKTFTATFADDLTVTDVTWTVTEKIGDAPAVTGEPITGNEFTVTPTGDDTEYTFVLKFTLNEKDYSFTYEMWAGLMGAIHDNSDKVNYDAATKSYSTVEGGAGWDIQRQIDFTKDNNVGEFDITLTVTMKSTVGTNFRVAHLNVLDNARGVMRYSTPDDEGGKKQLGFDGGAWQDVDGYFVADKAVTYRMLRTIDTAGGKSTITFILLGDDGESAYMDTKVITNVGGVKVGFGTENANVTVTNVIFNYSNI